MSDGIITPRGEQDVPPHTVNDVTTVCLGEQRLTGVFFVSVMAEPSPQKPVHETGRADITHVATDDLTRMAHIRHSLIDQISNANCKILFCSFLFADEEIVRALCEAAERLRGGVYILTALGKHLRAEVLDLDASIDAYTTKLQERAARHDDHLQRLAYAGAWLRSAEDCHAKFCVVDDTCAVITSANATQEAYESNPEDGLVLRSASTAQEYGRLFSYIWQHLTTLESTPGARLDVHSLAAARAPAWRRLTGTNPVRPVTTLRRDEASLLDAALKIIDGATEHLAIATYSFMGMEDHPIGASLAGAIARNVSVDLLVQPRNHIEAQRQSLSWLMGLTPDRVRLHGHRRTHTKSIVADGDTVLLWTGNLESRHGWDNGIEVGVVVNDRGVALAVAGWTANVMARRTHAAVNAPSVRELVAAGQASALPGEWEIHLPPGIQSTAVVQALSNNPVELLEGSGRKVLQCGSAQYLEVRIDSDNRRIDLASTRHSEALVGMRSVGWLSDTKLRVVAADPTRSEPTTHNRPQHPSRRRKGGKR